MGKRKKSASGSDSEDSSDDKKKKKKKADSSSEEESDSSDGSGSGSDSSSSDAKKNNKKGGKKNKKATKKKGKDKKAKKNKGKSKKDKKGKDKAKGKKAKKDKKGKGKTKDGSDDEEDEKASAKEGSDGSEGGEGSKKKKKKKNKDAKKDGSEDNEKEAAEDEEEQSSDPEFEPQFTIHKGLSPGGDVFSSQTTVEKAKRKCAKIKELKGFSYQGEDTGGVMLIFFKDFSTKIFPSSDWTCFKLIDEEEKAKQAAEQSTAAGEAQDDDGDKEDEDAHTSEKRGDGADELEKQAREREARALEAENREKELKAKWDAEQRQALLEKWEKERSEEAREKAEKEEKEESPKEEVKSEDESSKGDDDNGPAPAAAPEEIKPSKEELEKIEMERRKEELAEFQGSTEKTDGGMILSMWKEDVHVKGHHSVWGSWYDADWGEWGYACCQQKERDAKCTGKKVVKNKDASKFVNQDDIKELTSDSGESSGEDHADGEHRVVDFSNAPAELKPRSAFGGSSAAYIEHFLRYWIGVWRKESETNPKFDGYTDIEKAAFGGSLPEVEKAITPLIWRMRSGKTLERGEGKWKHKSRETRTGMDGKYVKEHGVLQSLDQMASFASEREYAKSNTTYTRLTFGNKMWNLTFVAHVSACTMKGAREYRRNRDSLNTYDADPVSQKYMHAMKKIIQFAQVKNPSEDMSKNIVM